MDERFAPDCPQEVRQAAPLLDESPARLRFIRDYLQVAAEYHAALSRTGLADVTEGETAVVLAGIGVARWIGANRDEGVIGARSAWATANRRIDDFQATLKRRIWNMCKARRPGEVIIAEAMRVAVDMRIWLPADGLVTITRELALSIAGPKWVRPRGR